jgi:multidrug transporter EmrE-like cation transporter
MAYLYLLGTIVFTVYGQLILKWRIGQSGQLPEGFLEKVMFLFGLLLDPFIFSGFVSAFVASFFWMAAMTRFDVSYAYPFITAGLTLVTVIMAVIILDETLGAAKISGLLLIVSGVMVLGFAK